ncbi:hypothetical protein J4430_01170, partial [Candidatus Woesearchaeota archaeon]|nr:hypothetical protein [Candidatus Woesearchaeota archaeon]
IVNSPPNTVNLNRPSNVTNFTSVPQFNWSNSTDNDTDVITYLFEVSPDVGFTSFTYTNYTIAEKANTTAELNANIPTEGTYYWHVIATDTLLNATASAAWRFTYDKTPPNITFLNITNTTSESIINATIPATTGENLTIRVNATDLYTQTSAVWVVIWSGVHDISSRLFEGFLNLLNGIYSLTIQTNITYPFGLVNYTVYANDTLNQTSTFTGNFTLLANTTLFANTTDSIVEYSNSTAIFALYNLSNGTIVSGAVCNATFDGGVSGMPYNASLARYENLTFNTSSHSLGTHGINVLCSTQYHVSRNDTTVLTVQDTITPKLNLTTLNASWFKVSTVNLNYTVFDMHSIQNCTVYFNGAVNQTNTTVTNSTLQ